MVKRLIGSDTTGTDGSVSIPYNGTGAGLVNLSVETEIDGSIVSETFNVYDAWMRDGGVTGDANNDDWLVQTGGSRSVQSDGTVFSGDTGTLFAWINKHGTTHSGLTDIAEYSGDYGIELTVVEVNGSARCSIYEAYPSPKRVDIPLSVGKWRITRINNVVIAYKDGVLTPITSLSLTAPQRIGIITSQGDSVKLRDVSVYGLGGTELGLTANKQIIESGETTTLSAYLSEGSGNTVQLYNADTDTLIGTMTDAGNGQYTYTVTGTGSGQKRFYAKYGSLQSETFTIIDGTFVDIATTNKKNNYWFSSANPTIRTNDDGTTLTEVTNGVAYLISTVESTTTWANRRFIDTDFCIEVDLANVENTKFVFYGVTGTPQLSLTDGHYKIKVTSTGITYSIDNGSETTLTSTEITNANVGFIDAGSGATTIMKFTYKNFVIYPI